jgi:hypothetical protein
MAQNVFINVSAGSTKVDAAKPGHTSARGASASGDLTVSFDTSKVTTITLLEKLLKQAVTQARSGKELTA